MDKQNIIKTTQDWLAKFIIEYNICPFAKQVYDKQGIRYIVTDAVKLEEILAALLAEFNHLDQTPATATTLLILKSAVKKFDDYLDLLEIANQLVIDFDYEGKYQLASFHPQYCFANTQPDAVENFTNRSPFPMLHILREADIEAVLKNYPNPELIPERNIQQMQKIGLSTIQAILKPYCNSSL